ncbi:MAG: oxidoreductase [Deltaproteobacteria bacterium]|uniref:proton-conducting transporter transmembrane domain-containing protein n=1 Tax=Hydrosulfovibrio ferrireducens TaxID=2934181 RepID=UPI001214645A|nr:MAG: oxidoreductase [Deltaproteobacteria bacterium]
MNLLCVAFFLFILGALLALLPGRGGDKTATLLGSGSAILGCLCGLVAAGQSLLGGGAVTFFLPWSMPGGAFSLRLDGLSAFFLLPLFIVGLTGALYGAEYMKGGKERLRPGLHWTWYNLLILSMTLVVTAANGLLFLFAWECMSLTSFFLVISEYDLAEAVEAGWTYLLATHLGAAFLFAFFLSASALSGSLEFASFQVLGQLSLPVASALFLLLLIGFGSKAGIFPFHVWLPDAHPAAPSHVSALMSGVMVKTAIYGLLRLSGFLPAGPAWWGGLLMAIGIIGALFGIAMAAMQRDVKRSLAYSTVENIGIILLALGFWMQSRANGHHVAAAFALAGGLIHLLNHALFKSLLFMGAGSLMHGSGSRDLNRMGGLMRRMPVTGLLIVCGGLAISALPPFNGLVGEWFIYRALLESGTVLSGLPGFFPLVLIGLLALVGGMVIVVMTRIIGIALAGEPRSQAAARALEAGWPMWSSMAGLALLCLAGGIMPVLLLQVAGRAATLLDPAAATMLADTAFEPWWLGIMAVVLLGCILAAYTLLRWRQGREPVPTSTTWGCGFAFPTSRMSYSAESYTELPQSALFCSCLTPSTEDGRTIGFFPEVTRFFFAAPDPVLARLFKPFFRWAADVCSGFRGLQAGQLHVYLLYIFSATILLLFWVGQR